MKLKITKILHHHTVLNTATMLIWFEEFTVSQCSHFGHDASLYNCLMTEPERRGSSN